MADVQADSAQAVNPPPPSAEDIRRQVEHEQALADAQRQLADLEAQLANLRADKQAVEAERDGEGG